MLATANQPQLTTARLGVCRRRCLEIEASSNRRRFALDAALTAVAMLPLSAVVAKEGPPVTVDARGITFNALLPEPPDASWVQHEGAFDDPFFADFTVSKAAPDFRYKVLQEGNSGANKPVVGQEVSINYRGYLLDGTPVDSSFVRGKPLTVRLGSAKVISGWTAAITGMTPGMRLVVQIPPKFAYGDKGKGLIPPDAAVVYYVELVSVGSIS